MIIWSFVVLLAQMAPYTFEPNHIPLQFIVGSSVISGILIGIFSTILHLVRLKNAGIDISKLNSSDLKVRQSKEIIASGSKQEIQSRLVKSFQKKIKEVHRDYFLVRQFNWFGWNKTEIDLTNLTEDKPRIQVRSRPRFLALIDFGQSAIMLKQVEALLKGNTDR